jgi:predicted metallo-beta-lactamase superfamily hydrolase
VNIVPLAADSLGVRSVATWVACGETRVLIDPGASLGESRFNLPPSDAEWEALKRANDRISDYAGRASVIFVSHYHDDHFRYDPGLYDGRTVWAKDPKRSINPRQAERAVRLWKGLAERCRLDSAEGRRLETPDAVLTASPPLPHGTDGTAMGHVVALTVTDRREGTRFLHASDVQGPMSPVAAAYVIRERPHVLYLSGPPAYLESQLGRAAVDRGIDNLLGIIERTGCRVIMDHHALRDAGYRERFARLWDTGRVVTAAGFLGLDDSTLEARRRDLWAGQRKPAAPLQPRTSRERDARRLKSRPASARMQSRRATKRAKGGATE